MHARAHVCTHACSRTHMRTLAVAHTHLTRPLTLFVRARTTHCARMLVRQVRRRGRPVSGRSTTGRTVRVRPPTAPRPLRSAPRRAAAHGTRVPVPLPVLPCLPCAHWGVASQPECLSATQRVVASIYKSGDGWAEWDARMHACMISIDGKMYRYGYLGLPACLPTQCVSASAAPARSGRRSAGIPGKGS
jgi:hypothetical protein